MTSKLSYRPDIDGLRAVAVLCVLFYHAGFSLFSGGFVGVDVFFVISGFLITTIIVGEIEAGEFSFARFYERRIRRIYPALYATITLVMLAAFLLYDPRNFKQVSESAIAATLFISNVLFWNQAGYFDAPSSLKPLLHTWSLAVEEQFYIVFPLMVWLLMRFARRWYKPALAGLAGISFLLSVYAMGKDSTSAFYFFHLRAWELLAGSLLAVNLIRERDNTTLRNLLSLAGLTMILFSVFRFSHETPFPGISALLPTVGSALLIYSGLNSTTLVGKFLSLPPIVFIGKISYSLYLWHWPIFIFGKYYIIREPTIWDTTIGLAASFALASLSWKFIENPFRARTFLETPRIFAFAAGVMVLTLTIAGTAYFNKGFPGRFDIHPFTQVLSTDKQWEQWRKCNNDVVDDVNNLIVCDINAGDASPSFLLWGDSHARALVPAVEASAQRNNLSGQMITRPACLPLLGVEWVGERRCGSYNEVAIQYLKIHPELQTVILAGRWALSAEGSRYKNEDRPDVILMDRLSSAPKGQNSVIFESALDRTVSRLIAMNRRVVIVTSIPEVGYDVDSANFIGLRTGRDINTIIAPTFEEYLQRNRVVLSVMDEIKLRYNVQIIDPSTVLCGDVVCRVAVDGQPLYRDMDHLSTYGALFISEIFDLLFEGLSRLP